MKYKELIAKTKELIEKAQVPFKNAKTEKELELKIIEVESEIATQEFKVEEQKSKHPIDWNIIIDGIDELDLKKRKLKLLNQLQQELF